MKQINDEIIAFFYQYGFDKKQKKITTDTFEYIFAKNNLFVIFKGSSCPHDFPGFINIIVGNGDYTYPALDKTGYPLWRIVRYKEQNDEFSEYKFEDIYDDNFINKLKSDVSQYLEKFLKNGIVDWV
jgi:hypothetical protein